MFGVKVMIWDMEMRKAGPKLKMQQSLTQVPALLLTAYSTTSSFKRKVEIETRSCQRNDKTSQELRKLPYTSDLESQV